MGRSSRLRCISVRFGPVCFDVSSPQHRPVEQRDAHLRAPASDVLGRAALQARFMRPPPHYGLQDPNCPSWLQQRFFAAEQRPAAVLIAIHERDNGHGGREPHILLTRRASHLHQHAGQIAFPGGRCELADGGNLIATALRESEEEIALPRAQVQVLGCLPQYHSRTGYAITPVVAWLDQVPPLRPSPDEVEAIFWVPLSFVLNPAQHQHQRWTPRDGRVGWVLSMQWHSPQGEPHYIWGVSADLLRMFYHFVSAPIDPHFSG